MDHQDPQLLGQNGLKIIRIATAVVFEKNCQLRRFYTSLPRSPTKRQLIS